MSVTWSKADESQLRMLIARKEKVAQARRATVDRLVGTFYFHNIGQSEIVDWLIENAAAVRDVLEIFDTRSKNHETTV